MISADALGTLVLFEPASGSGFGSVFTQAVSGAMQAACGLSFHVEVVDDENGLEETLSKFVDSATCTVVVCAPRSGVGPAAEVLYRMRASGTAAAFVGYGDFSKDALAQLLRLGADDVIAAGVPGATITAAIERAAGRVASRTRSERAYCAARHQITALKQSSHEIEDRFRVAREVVIESLLMALSVRELDSVAHSMRVRAYTAHLAQITGYPECMRETLEHAAMLHDIGKIGMSDEILFRTGWLTHNELQQLEPHADFGARIVERIEFLRPLAPIIRHHHERFDGHGFPARLAGTAIPLGARIFAIADSLDAMTSDKPYRAAMAFEVAAEEIHRGAGKQFDPDLVERVLSVAPGTWQDICERAINDFRSRSSLFSFPAMMPFAQTA